MRLLRQTLPRSGGLLLIRLRDRGRMTEEVDRIRVEALAAQLFVAVRPDLARQPFHRDNVFVVLNALALVAATVIAGADQRAQDFFLTALTNNIGVVKAHADT